MGKVRTMKNIDFLDKLIFDWTKCQKTNQIDFNLHQFGVELRLRLTLLDLEKVASSERELLSVYIYNFIDKWTTILN